MKRCRGISSWLIRPCERFKAITSFSNAAVAEPVRCCFDPPLGIATDLVGKSSSSAAPPAFSRSRRGATDGALATVFNNLIPVSVQQDGRERVDEVGAAVHRHLCVFNLQSARSRYRRFDQTASTSTRRSCPSVPVSHSCFTAFAPFESELVHSHPRSVCVLNRAETVLRLDRAQMKLSMTSSLDGSKWERARSLRRWTIPLRFLPRTVACWCFPVWRSPEASG
jgi:hypothetical protein